MALLGYLYGITSERKLADECRLNLTFMWFLEYDIDEIPPNHSILSKARKRFGRATYEQFFKEIVKLCEEAGLVEGNKVFLDATLLKANASFDSLEDVYICPQGKKMYPMETYENGSILYWVHRSACKGCPYKGVL